MIQTAAILVIVGVSKDLLNFIPTHRNSKNSYYSWLTANSNLGAQAEVRSQSQSRRRALPDELPRFPRCSPLCKQLQTSRFRASFEISSASKAAKTWRGGGGWFSISIAPPGEKHVLGGFGAPVVFSVSVYTTSLEERGFFRCCCCYWFIREQGQTTSNPAAVAPHVIRVPINKFVPCIFRRGGRSPRKAPPASLRQTQTFSAQLLSDVQGDEHLNEQI